MIDRSYGRIVNIASVAGKEGNPNASHYSASKAGLIGLTKSLGKELANKGVLVNASRRRRRRPRFRPDVAAAHRLHALEDPDGPVRRGDEVAAMVAWLATEDCSFSTGAVFDLSGGRATY